MSKNSNFFAKLFHYNYLKYPKKFNNFESSLSIDVHVQNLIKNKIPIVKYTPLVLLPKPAIVQAKTVTSYV